MGREREGKHEKLERGNSPCPSSQAVGQVKQQEGAGAATACPGGGRGSLSFLPLEGVRVSPPHTTQHKKQNRTTCVWQGSRDSRCERGSAEAEGVCGEHAKRKKLPVPSCQNAPKCPSTCPVRPVPPLSAPAFFSREGPSVACPLLVVFQPVRQCHRLFCLSLPACLGGPVNHRCRLHHHHSRQEGKCATVVWEVPQAMWWGSMKVVKGVGGRQNVCLVCLVFFFFLSCPGSVLVHHLWDTYIREMSI